MFSIIKRIPFYFLLSALLLLSACATPRGENEAGGIIIGGILGGILGHQVGGGCGHTVDASIGGKTEKIYGTACRQTDGSWQVKS
jgi:uncharacterized protein YcfJ